MSSAFFGWQEGILGYNVTYSATICTKGTVPLPIRTWVPINEEIWLPIRSLGLKSCDMGRLYWSQASILSYLSGWSRFRFFLPRNRQGDYISIQFDSRIMVCTFLFIAEGIRLLFCGSYPRLIFYLLLWCPLFSLLDQCQGTHFFIRKLFLIKVDKT